MARGRLSAWATAIALLLAPTGGLAAGWTPAMWVDEDVVQIRTTDPGEEAHWSKVWVAVVDDRLYVRLGSRAAGRIERNVTDPFVDVRIAGREFQHIRVVPAPDMAERVARELREKYWSDVFIRLLPHPLTLRLEPATEAGASAPAPEGATASGS